MTGSVIFSQKMTGERILGVGYNTVAKETVRLAVTKEKNYRSLLFNLEIKQEPGL